MYNCHINTLHVEFMGTNKLGIRINNLCAGCQQQKQSNSVYEGNFSRINKIIIQIFTEHVISEPEKLN